MRHHIPIPISRPTKSSLYPNFTFTAKTITKTKTNRFLFTNFSHNLSTLNNVSKNITQPKRQGASQAMLYAVGLNEADMNKAQVGISSVWYEGNPCNMHLLDLANEVKKSVNEAGLVGLRFNTVGVSDGISMGTLGMRYSLQSRELIADSIETVMQAQWYDANISIPGCDKNMPGCVIAMARVNRPSILLYGGTIRAGHGTLCGSKTPISNSKSGKTSQKTEINTVGKKYDIVSAFQSYGEYITGRISEEERQDIVRHACPGAGACGGMYTANTMASAIEALGLSLPYSSSAPANSTDKINECRAMGAAIRNLLEKDITPKKILTREAFHNAIVLTIVLGGSTNAVLHLIAISKAVRDAKVELTLEDFKKVNKNTPFLADLKPSGKYVMEDLHAVGGTPAVLKYLLENKMIYGDALTVTGKTLEENLKDLPGLKAGQDVVYPLEKPIQKTGHLAILHGSLAPEGAVAKITGKEGVRFKGPAKCYDCEEDMLTGLEKGEIKKGMVVFIRYEGPKGGPGMPEMLTPTSAIVGANLHKDVALVTDGRFSGGSHGFIIGHVTPEAHVGGPIGLVKDGDIIEIDAEKNTIDWCVSDQIKAQRKKEYVPKEDRVKFGTLAKYSKLVSTATHGCVTDNF